MNLSSPEKLVEAVEEAALALVAAGRRVGVTECLLKLDGRRERKESCVPRSQLLLFNNLLSSSLQNLRFDGQGHTTNRSRCVSLFSTAVSFLLFGTNVRAFQQLSTPFPRKQ